MKTTPDWPGPSVVLVFLLPIGRVMLARAGPSSRLISAPPRDSFSTSTASSVAGASNMFVSSSS